MTAFWLLCAKIDAFFASSSPASSVMARRSPENHGLKRSEQAITEERNYAEATLRTARDPLVILRPDLAVNTANESFYRTFGLVPAQTENRQLFDLADGAWNIPALRVLLGRDPGVE